MVKKAAIIITILINLIFVSSHTLLRHPRQLVYKKSLPFIDNCKYSVRQLELKWDKIQLFCEYFYEIDGTPVADSWFQTTSGTNFRHCRANSNKKYDNRCFDLPFDEEIWETYNFINAPTILHSSTDPQNNSRCHYRKTLRLKTFQVKQWVLKQPKCQKKEVSGYIGMPKKVKRFDTIPNKRYWLVAGCSNKSVLPQNDINWKNIDMFCYHFKDYYYNFYHVAEMSFRVRGGRGSFNFCHGLSNGFESQCFPGPWDKNEWIEWKFEHGEVHGKQSFGFFTVNNVICHSRKGAMGDVNGMKNWFKANEKGCASFTRAGFRGFDEKIVNAPL